MTDPVYAAQVALTIATGVVVLIATLAAVAAVAWCLFAAGVAVADRSRHRVTARRLHRQAAASGRQSRTFAPPTLDVNEGRGWHYPGRSFDYRDSPLDVNETRSRPLDGSEPIHRGAPQ